MFSQNVVDARELMMETGENLWDSQQNSQAWGSSQNSNSQVVPFGKSSQTNFKYGNEFPNRSQRFSNSSDYWSQSQGVSQPLQESDDGRGYHLKYLNRPALIPIQNNCKNNNEKIQVKSLNQCIESQRRKAFDLDSSNKLDSILSAFTESSHEINSSIGVLKSELTTEINDVSEKLSIDAKDIVERLEKFSGEMKENSKLMTEAMHNELEIPSEIIQKVNSKVENMELQLENIKAQILKSEEVNQQRNENVDAKLMRIEKFLLEIIPCITKSKSEQSIQTDSINPENNYANTFLSEIKVGQCHTDESASGEQKFESKNALAPNKGSFNLRQFNQKSELLSTISPAHKAIDSPRTRNQSSTIAVPSVVHNDAVKEEVFSDGGYLYNIKRQTSKRPSQLERNAEASSIFQFDLCSDLEDSEDSSPLSTVQVKKENISTPINQAMKSNDQCEIPYKKPCSKQFCSGNLKFSKTLKSSVQKSITSYGRIKKDNAIELVKIGAFSKSKTTKSKISPKDRVISPTLYFKEKLRVTSRGSVAQRRREYAESVFCFDDYADIKTLQFQIHNSKRMHNT